MFHSTQLDKTAFPTVHFIEQKTYQTIQSKMFDSKNKFARFFKHQSTRSYVIRFVAQIFFSTIEFDESYEKEEFPIFFYTVSRITITVVM